jgi:hypothetical protein
MRLGRYESAYKTVGTYWGCLFLTGAYNPIGDAIFRVTESLEISSLSALIIGFSAVFRFRAIMSAAGRNVDRGLQIHNSSKDLTNKIEG